MSKTFAELSHNVVTNLIVADTLETAQAVTGKTCIEYTDPFSVGIGWTYDGTNFVDPNLPIAE